MLYEQVIERSAAQAKADIHALAVHHRRSLGQRVRHMIRLQRWYFTASMTPLDQTEFIKY